MTKIGVLVGSLREGSFTRMVAETMASLLPEGYEAEFLEIGQLPHFDQDYEINNEEPESYGAFREKLRSMDAFLLATPEYNRSFPGVLKNALDVGSRPYGQNSFDGKPAAIVSVSPGNLSGFGANHHLRQVLTFLNMPVLQQPEAYVGNVMSLYDEQGNLVNEDTRQFFQAFIDAFVNLIEAVQKSKE